MHHPYIDSPAVALGASQAAVVVIWAMVAARRCAGSVALRGILVASGALAVVAPVFESRALLDIASIAVVIVALMRGRRTLIFAALLVSAIFAALCHHATGSYASLAGLHLMWLGAVSGLLARAPTSDGDEQRAHSVAAPLDDIALFLGAALAAAAVSVVVFDRSCVMDDEWANTFQAQLFGVRRAFASVPACSVSFENNWIFNWEGRRFAQFTPGWPLFLAPFARLGLPWLANPVCLGLLAVASARLGRRLAAENGSYARSSARTFGWIAAGSVVLSVSMLLNAGSRFAHVFVSAMFAWSVEAACVVRERHRKRGEQLAWGIALGGAIALMMSARPSDGLALGIPVGVVVLSGVAKRRVAVTSTVAALVTWMLVIVGSAVILKLQIGSWLRTGYSLTAELRPWAATIWSMPRWNEIDLALPFGAGSYCWLPCAPMWGVAGLLALEKRTVAVWTLLIGAFTLIGMYVFVDFGRLYYWAYGPRYQLPSLVAWGVGGCAWVAPVLLTEDAREQWHITAFRTIFVISVLVVLGWIGFHMYPAARAEARARTAPLRAIQRDHIHHAVVWVSPFNITANPSSLTQNSALETGPDVVLAIGGSLEQNACVRRLYPDRTFYRALGLDEVTLVEEVRRPEPTVP